MSFEEAVRPAGEALDGLVAAARGIHERIVEGGPPVDGTLWAVDSQGDWPAALGSGVGLDIQSLALTGGQLVQDLASSIATPLVTGRVTPLGSMTLVRPCILAAAEASWVTDPDVSSPVRVARMAALRAKNLDSVIKALDAIGDHEERDARVQRRHRVAKAGREVEKHHDLRPVTHNETNILNDAADRMMMSPGEESGWASALLSPYVHARPWTLMSHASGPALLEPDGAIIRAISIQAETAIAPAQMAGVAIYETFLRLAAYFGSSDSELRAAMIAALPHLGSAGTRQ